MQTTHANDLHIIWTNAPCVRLRIYAYRTYAHLVAVHGKGVDVPLWRRPVEQLPHELHRSAVKGIRKELASGLVFAVTAATGGDPKQLPALVELGGHGLERPAVHGLLHRSTS